MLQIITGKFFRDVELYTRRQRGVLYTNYRNVSIPITTVCGSLLPADTDRDVASVVYEVDERLEAVRLDGSREFLFAVGGDYLLQDFAAVTSFTLNVICSPDIDLVRRLTQTRKASLGVPHRPSRYVRRVFDETINFTPGDNVVLQSFISSLVGLQRKDYEAAIQAIRRYIVGLHRIGDDLEPAYTMFVASIESLAQDYDSFTPTWQDYDQSKRQPIDKVLKNVDRSVADDVRTAIIAGEHLALARRFREFAASNIAPSYFREEALLEQNPVRKYELRKALESAYSFRSKAVHTLRDLPRQLTVLPSYRDTDIVDEQPVLSLHGMARLAHHVIRQFIAHRPKIDKEEYDYRKALPNKVTARLAQRYWIWKSEGYNQQTAYMYLNGFLEELTNFLMQVPDPVNPGVTGVTDISSVIEKIEVQIKGFAKATQRLPMLALYTLYNVFSPPDMRRPDFLLTLEKYDDDLKINSPEGLLIKVLTIWEEYVWKTTDFDEAWQAYDSQRIQKRGLRFGSVLDAAALLVWAEACRKEGDSSRVFELVSMAVEELPGKAKLLELEASIKALGNNAIPLIEWRTILLPTLSDDGANQNEQNSMLSQSTDLIPTNQDDHANRVPDEENDGDGWDAQIEEDAAAGKLDALAEEALAEYRAGKATEV